mmetsp:Transcript_13971/g.15423  ORF Transcript_13971/g.15423 Transcript_13971/m.15423 type:complete len:362 (-) Transcript_13971:23-1108(-)
MSQEGNINHLVPGKKVLGIFGFCSIRQFMDTTDYLQESIMMFVNEIARIVHTSVDHFSGQCNKNIGDAFLFVWKFEEKDVIAEEGQELSLRNYNSVYQIADMSLVAFISVIIQLERSRKLRDIKSSPLLRNDAILDSPAVQMGFGLHYGWAIEGAIGSEHKIDASYLSPHVNLASRMESATKQYGVPILLTEQIWDLLSNQTKEYTRRIDRVVAKGTRKPINIYTCNIDRNNLDLDQKELLPFNGENPETKKRDRVRARIRRTRLREAVVHNKFYIWTILESDDDLIKMRADYTPAFLEVFKMGLSAYLAGDWTNARSQLLKAQVLKPNEDAPTESILSFMSSYSFRPPADWNGYRNLTDK